MLGTVRAVRLGVCSGQGGSHVIVVDGLFAVVLAHTALPSGPPSGPCLHCRTLAAQQGNQLACTCVSVLGRKRGACFGPWPSREA
eukprot:11351221-Alexandrium_andersonii.AAC.1